MLWLLLEYLGNARENINDKISRHGNFLEFTCKFLEQFCGTPRRDGFWLLNCFLFSNTFSDVQEKSDQIWKYERYNLVIEYHNRPGLVPPFILLSHIWLLLQYIHRKCTNKENKSPQNHLRKLVQFFTFQLHGCLFISVLER